MTAPTPRKFLRQHHLAQRWQRTPRTISRWKHDNMLPEPDLIINGVSHWAESTIERVERENFAAKNQPAA